MDATHPHAANAHAGAIRGALSLAATCAVAHPAADHGLAGVASLALIAGLLVSNFMGGDQIFPPIP